MAERESQQLTQPSLFGRGEQQNQLRRLRLPTGLEWLGRGVSPAMLKRVLEKVDDFDRDGVNGRGCFASSQLLADEMQISKKTVDRALAILTETLGFLTRTKRQVGLRTIVDRRICWAAIRAYNDGEALEGEGHQAQGEGHLARGEGHQAPKVRDTGVPLTETPNRKESPPTEAAVWGAVAASLRERGLTHAPRLITKARNAGANASDILRGVEHFDAHAESSGWKPAALGWWLSNWQPFGELTDNWPPTAPVVAADVDFRSVARSLSTLDDDALAELVGDLLDAEKFRSIRQMFAEDGRLAVIEPLAREMTRRCIPVPEVATR